MSKHHVRVHWSTTAAQLKPRFERAVDAGTAVCGRCHRMIHPGDKWDIGHVIDLSTGQRGRGFQIEHRRCNRSAGGKLGAAKTNATRRRNQVETKRLPGW